MNDTMSRGKSRELQRQTVKHLVLGRTLLFTYLSTMHVYRARLPDAFHSGITAVEDGVQKIFNICSWCHRWVLVGSKLCFFVPHLGLS